MVSVIIPCFNQARYLPSAVDSCLVQTYEHVEIVLVDDGSTDGTAEQMRRIADENPARNITLVLSDTNSGLAAARNAGIEAAAGELILPLDCDDFLHPTCVERMEQVMRDGATVVSADRLNFGASLHLVQPRWFVASMLPLANQLSYCSMFTRDLWKRVGGYRDAFPINGYEDWEFWIGCMERGATFRHIPEILWYYRVRPSGMAAGTWVNDDYLKARIVANHEHLYAPETVEWAAAILKRGPLT